MKNNNTVVEKDQYEFTLCFLVQNQQVLMLERQKEPNKGLWNGVGGHIELGESPNHACVREIEEETGILVDGIHFCGVLSWESWYFPAGGMYIYRADPEVTRVVASDEGPLEWKPVDWVLHSDRVVANIPLFLPDVLSLNAPQRYHCLFDEKKLLNCETMELPAWVNTKWLQDGRFRQ